MPYGSVGLARQRRHRWHTLPSKICFLIRWLATAQKQAISQKRRRGYRLAVSNAATNTARPTKLRQHLEYLWRSCGNLANMIRFIPAHLRVSETLKIRTGQLCDGCPRWRWKPHPPSQLVYVEKTALNAAFSQDGHHPAASLFSHCRRCLIRSFRSWRSMDCRPRLADSKPTYQTVTLE